MDEEKSKQNIISCTDTPTTAKSQLNNNNLRHRILQNFLLIWLDSNIEESSGYCQNAVTQLQNIVNNVNIFTEPDQCIDFLTDIVDQKVFMIISKTNGEKIISSIHEIPQLSAIYVLDENEFEDKSWIKNCSKVKGIYAQVTLICKDLQQAVKQCDKDSISLSFVSADEDSFIPNLNQLDPSFMYTQIIKEILFEMKNDEQSMNDLVHYWRSQYIGNDRQLSIIDKFASEYHPESSIWWYTREAFTYQILNQALRNIEADIIIKMGFYIRDLHHQIKELHIKQLDDHNKELFVVYRGQGLYKTDFEKLTNTKCGLISFNNFLSTSKDRQLSLALAESVAQNSGMVGILFTMIIDSSISSTPFALIDKVSYFQEEEEILFSMHTVFRISEIKKMNNDDRVYEVELKLTDDNDQQLRILTDHIRKETLGSTGWERLASLLVKLNQFEKAEQLCAMLLDQNLEEKEKALVFNNLGCIQAYQNNYKEAIFLCEKAMEIWQKTFPSNDPRLALSYQNIASVYRYMGEYSKALSLCDKALEILEKTLPDHSKLAHSYYEIASVYENLEQYPKALLIYNKSLNIYQKTLPSNHPELASCYQRVGGVHNSIGQYFEALSSYNKAHDIYQKALPSDHPNLANSNNSIGQVYFNMGQYSIARSFYNKALKIFEKNLCLNHVDLASSYNKIGEIDYRMGEYSTALLFYEKAFNIYQKKFPSNHPNLAITYTNIGALYFAKEEYSKAMSFYQKALRIYEEILATNHTYLAASYNNIGLVYRKMGEYSEALLFYNKALVILQNVLPSNHSYFAASYNNIGLVHMHMAEYSQALSWCNKALKICQETQPPNLPLMATCYNYICLVHCNMKDFSNALTVGKRAFQILQQYLPINHPDLQTLRNNLDDIRKKL